jgi:hypothetical protein
MIKVRCICCGKVFEVVPYRLRNGKQISCSRECASQMLGRLLTGRPRLVTSKVLEEMKHLYEWSGVPINKIAFRLGLSRATVHSYARREGWGRYGRVFKLRKRYRDAAEQLLGRKLKKGEHVHHIDGDKENNEPSNLTVFAGPKLHELAHRSLQLCAFQLLATGAIQWDTQSQSYKLPRGVTP